MLITILEKEMNVYHWKGGHPYQHLYIKYS